MAKMANLYFEDAEIGASCTAGPYHGEIRSMYREASLACGELGVAS